MVATGDLGLEDSCQDDAREPVAFPSSDGAFSDGRYKCKPQEVKQIVMMSELGSLTEEVL